MNSLDSYRTRKCHETILGEFFFIRKIFDPLEQWTLLHLLNAVDFLVAPLVRQWTSTFSAILGGVLYVSYFPENPINF